MVTENNGVVSDQDLIETLWMASLTLRSPGTCKPKVEGKTPEHLLVELVSLFLDGRKFDRIGLMETMDDDLLGDCRVIEVKNFEKKKLRLMTKNMYLRNNSAMNSKNSTFFGRSLRVIASCAWN